MKTFSRMLSAALLIAAGTVTGSMAAGQTSVDAANGPCWDQIKDNRTPVRAGAGFNYRILKWKYAGQQVTGPCWIAENTTQKYRPTLWYMVNYVHGRGGYAYIWAPQLRYFSKTGQCYPYHCHYTS